MPIEEMRTGKQTGMNKSDESVMELCGGTGEFLVAGFAAVSFLL
jgi:hypothetical protein